MRILIAGGGEVASLIARRLSREGNEITIVEENADRCVQLEEHLDAKIVHGSAVSIKTMRAAGLANADMLIAATTVDHVNLLACMIAQAEGNVKVKVARMRTHEVDHWRRVCAQTGLHIDLIIHPEGEVIRRILPVLRFPGVSDIVEFAGGKVKLFGMAIDRSSWVAGKTMEELDRAGPPKNSLIAMIFRGQQVIIPRGPDTLQPGDVVYVVTTGQELEEDLRFMGLRASQSLKSIFIVGGKQIGIGIAQELESQGKNVRLFESDGGRCEKISHLTRDTLVIHGDGTDELTLREENVDRCDAYLALTGHDEDNIIGGLLARRLGARKVVALVNKLNYLPMAQLLGISTTVSPRAAAVDGILQFVRKGRVQSVITFRQEEAEAIELIAAPGARYIGKRLRDVRMPRGSIVGAIVKPSGEAIVPRGDASIEPGDRVIFFAIESAVPDLEAAFVTEPRGVR
ncbi:MAG: Trk system potassium transporter TrkA [Bryobacteraceae bacterium]